MDNNLNGALSSMRRVVKKYADGTLAKYRRDKAAKQGIIRGNRLVYNNRSYSYTPVVDEYFEDGDEVWFLLDDAGTTAIVVGV